MTSSSLPLQLISVKHGEQVDFFLLLLLLPGPEHTQRLDLVSFIVAGVVSNQLHILSLAALLQAALVGC